MRFALFVEGYTERALSSFLKRWLDPRLSRPVGVEPVRFAGSAEYLKSFAQRAKRSLDSGRLIAVIGLLDLYGAGLTFPPNLRPDAKCAWAKGELERQVGDSRFRQHFAVHETEAWLLSDPSVFPTSVQAQIKKLAHQPESVNFQQPPSKRLHAAYRVERRDYKKVTDGSNLFGKLIPDSAYVKCLHLALLLDDMLSLAKGAGL